MKVLVTGGNGFLGTALVRELSRHHDVTVITREIKEEDKNNKARYCVGDLVDISSIGIEDDFDAIIHSAALVPKNANEDIASHMVQVNIQGTINLLEKFTRSSKIIFISTLETYGQSHNEINVNSAQNPESFYGASKVAAEKFSSVYSLKNNKKLTILRISNIYGPGDEIDRAIPNFVKAAIKNKPLSIYGDGSELRDFIYLDDAVNGIISALNSQEVGIFNLCQGKSVTIMQTASLILEISKSQSKLIIKPRKKPKYDILINNENLIDINFAPSVSLKDGLERTIKWYKKNEQYLF
jgi:nucleoside-diphosphate-sugar epimerase